MQRKGRAQLTATCDLHIKSSRTNRPTSQSQPLPIHGYCSLILKVVSLYIFSTFQAITHSQHQCDSILNYHCILLLKDRASDSFSEPSLCQELCVISLNLLNTYEFLSWAEHSECLREVVSQEGRCQKSDHIPVHYELAQHLVSCTPMMAQLQIGLFDYSFNIEQFCLPELNERPLDFFLNQ